MNESSSLAGGPADCRRCSLSVEQLVKRKKYRVQLVTAEHEEKRRASWTWQGRKFRGTDFIYRVVDENFDRLNEWTFSVRVPDNPGQTVVQPQTVPGKSAFAQVGRRPITFQRATRHPHRRYAYCKVHLADPSMQKNWRGTTRGDRRKLPPWFKYFDNRMRLKDTVTTTAGNDGWDQVVLILPGDHERMIRLYFAMRVWVLQEYIVLS